MSFLTPIAMLIAVLIALPLAAFVVAERQRRRVNSLLGLGEPGRARRLAPALAIALAGVFVSVAAGQPTFVHASAQRIRTDAEAFFVLDTSLSMQASQTATSPSRFDRSRSLAIRLRGDLADIPVGLASITDRAMPHLFPSADRDTFDATARKSIGIERPPPSDGFSVRITTLGSLSRMASDNFFSPSAQHRLLVVFTDGETKPFLDASLGTLFRGPPPVRTIFVHVWGAHERVFLNNGSTDPLYRPDPTSTATIQQLAATAGGTVVEVANYRDLLRSARRDLGSGPTAVLTKERRSLALAPWFAGFAFLPLGLLLWRRNV